MHRPVNAQRQRFDSLQQQKRVERADGRAEIAETFHAGAHDELNVAKWPAHAKHVAENQAMITRRWLAELRVFAIAPVVVAAIDNHPADARAVSANPLCSRLYHHGRAVFEGPEQITTRPEGVVHDNGQVVLLRHVGDGIEIGDIKLRIANGF